MLSSEDRLYFIHIPKTAGTTLIPLLDARFHAHEICPAQLWCELVTLPRESLPRYRLFRGHFGAGGLKPFLPEPPLYLTMLRHPVALALSTFRFILREPGTRVHGLVKAENMTLSDFLDHPDTWDKASDKQVRQLSFDLQCDPDTSPIFLSSESRAAVDKWIKDHDVSVSDEHRLERARAILHNCAWFGLTERFEESMALLSWTFGWPCMGQVQQLRISPDGAASPDALPDAVRAKVLGFNQQDLVLYQEAERLFEARLVEMLRDLARYGELGERVPATFAENPPLIDTLLDRHYWHNCPLRADSGDEAIRLTLQEPLYGSGWHRREVAPADNSTFRWSGPDTESFIDLPGSTGQARELTFRVVNALAPGIIDSLQVKANGCAIELDIIEGQGREVRLYRGVIPASADPGPLTRLNFSVNRTVSPRCLDPDNPDERQVGIALNWLRVRRLPLAANPHPEACGQLESDQNAGGLANAGILRRITSSLKRKARKHWIGPDDD